MTVTARKKARSVVVKHACAICGRRDTAERMVRSAYTHKRYCRPGVGCAKRTRS